MNKDDIELQPVNLPGGGKSIIEYDRSLWMQGADRRRPLRLEVSVAVEAPDAQGFAEGAEADELDGVKYRVVRAVKRARGAHVMTVTGAAKQVHISYLAPSVGLLRKRDPREVLGSAMAAVEEESGRTLEVTWFDDPEWSRLLGIFEEHDPALWKTDRALMVHMAKAGDAIHARRVVGHRCFFDERADCRDFLRDARKTLRLKADGGPKPAPPGSPKKLVVVVERLEPTIVTWHIHPVALSVKGLVTKHRGVYDGWETELIASLIPPPLTPPQGG